MVCFRQIETKKMQDANDQVKLSGDPQVKGKIGDQIADQLNGIRYIHRGNDEVIIDVAIQDEVDHTSEHPLKPFLIDLVLVLVVVRPAKCAVIYNWKEGKDDVWQ